MEKEILEKIIDALSDRNGFDDWWRNIDSDTQEEIRQELESIVNKSNKAACASGAVDTVAEARVCDHRYHSRNGRYMLYEDWCEKCGEVL